MSVYPIICLRLSDLIGENLQQGLNLQLILYPFQSYSKLPKKEAKIKMVFWC